MSDVVVALDATRRTGRTASGPGRPAAQEGARPAGHGPSKDTSSQTPRKWPLDFVSATCWKTAPNKTRCLDSVMGTLKACATRKALFSCLPKPPCLGKRTQHTACGRWGTACKCLLTLRTFIHVPMYTPSVRSMRLFFRASGGAQHHRKHGSCRAQLSNPGVHAPASGG